MLYDLQFTIKFVHDTKLSPHNPNGDTSAQPCYCTDIIKYDNNASSHP